MPNANVIYEEIWAKGYTGGKTLLRLFMQPLRPTVIQKATVRFETPPGYQVPDGLGPFSGGHGMVTPKRMYAFVMVLAYSRTMYVEFTENEKLDTFIGCHIRAFEYFGGRPEVILYET